MKVFAGQVRRANGGLWYRSSLEFQEALTLLLEQAGQRDALGHQGLAYVERRYRWPTVLSRVEGVLAQVTVRRVRPAR